MLGRPLHTDQLEDERLGKPTALAVFASDNLSSAAYATVEILHTLLIAGVGIIAFSYVLPITAAMLCVLFLLILKASARPSRPIRRRAARTSSPRTTSARSRRRWPGWPCSPTAS